MSSAARDEEAASTPRFERRGGEIVETKRGPALRLERPHLVLSLSPNSAAVLASLPGTAAEVAARTGIGTSRVLSFLRTFESRNLVRRHAARRPRRFAPTTVIIPAYGRPDATRATVLSVLAQQYPKDRLEVVVVDDASPEALRLDLDDYSRVRVVRLAENGGPAAARNAGVAEAGGELVAFIDNDCTADPEWLAILVATLEEPDVDVAAGRAIAPSTTGIVARYEAARSPLDMGANRSLVGPNENVPYVPSCNLVVRKSVYETLDGFRKGMHLGEDVDFVWRAQAAGSLVIYEPAAMIVHHHRDRLGQLLVRRAQYATSEGELGRLHRAARRELVLPFTVLCALVSLTFARWSLVPALVAAGLVVHEIVTKRAQLAALSLPPRAVGLSVVRAHGASLFHLSAALSRYHGVPLLVLALLVPRARLIVAVLLSTYPIIDARIRRARVALPLYVLLYTLEMAAYAIGVQWGRVKHRYFTPARVRFRR